MIRHDYSMPSADEVLRGDTQGGVPRPAVLDRMDDIVFAPRDGQAVPETVPIPSAPASSRWQAAKALLRIIFRGQ